jgi:hypothetical protein
MSRENQQLSCSELQLAGVRSQDLLNGLIDDRTVIKLTSKDRKKIFKMLQRPIIQQDQDLK